MSKVPECSQTQIEDTDIHPSVDEFLRTLARWVAEDLRNQMMSEKDVDL